MGQSQKDADAELDYGPIAKFSGNTAWQFNAVRYMAKQIRTKLLIEKHNPTDGPNAYECFWFWLLGAYELVRTMDEHGQCFAPEFAESVKTMKRRLAALRIPFAKQQLQGRRAEPVLFELSFSGVRPGTMLFEVRGQCYDVASLLDEMDEFMKSLTREAIIDSIPVRRL